MKRDIRDWLIFGGGAWIGAGWGDLKWPWMSTDPVIVGVFVATLGAILWKP